MTFITLTQPKIHFYSSTFVRGSEWNLRRVKRFTLFSIGCIFATILTYLVATYFIFSWGFKVDEDNLKLDALSKDVSELELTLQKKKSVFLEENREFLSTLEKVSSIRYIKEGDSYVSSDSIPTP